MNKTDTTYSIGAVSNLTGIEKHKLRNWCDRYLTHIQKIEIGNTQHRRFTEEDIKIIKRIDQLMKDGHTLKSAADKSIKQYKEG
jgi:DNA-binding transcriptional MerR regulator